MTSIQGARPGLTTAGARRHGKAIEQRHCRDKSALSKGSLEKRIPASQGHQKPRSCGTIQTTSGHVAATAGAGKQSDLLALVKAMSVHAVPAGRWRNPFSGGAALKKCTAEFSVASKNAAVRAEAAV